MAETWSPSRLKQQLDGEIVVYASRQLVHALMEHDLVDEVRLMVFHVVLGTGDQLFGRTSERESLCLVGMRPVGDSLADLRYEVVHRRRRVRGVPARDGRLIANGP